MTKSKQMTMSKMNTYQAPRVLQDLPLELESEILAGSVSEKTTVKTTGQKVEEYNFAETSFNQVWE